MLESQSRSDRQSRGVKKLKQESAPRLQAVDGQGISWKNQSVGTIGAILKVKTNFLETFQKLITINVYLRLHLFLINKKLTKLLVVKQYGYNA